VRIFLTGFADDDVFTSAKAHGAFKLRKPWGDELELILRNAIEHKRLVARMQDELQGYVAVSAHKGALAEAPVGAADVVVHLRRMLESLEWVDEVEIAPIGSKPPRGTGASWLPMVGATTVPGRPGSRMIDTWIAGRYRARVCWQGLEEYRQRVVELAIQRAADALQMRDLTDQVRARAAEAEAARAAAIHRDRIAALGAIMASVAHDIRSPLAVLASNQQFIAERLQGASPEVATDLAEVFDDNKLAVEMIEGVLMAIRTVALAPESGERVDVDAALHLATRLMRWELTRTGVELELDIEEAPLAVGTPGEVCQIVMNLVSNAAQVAPRGSVIRARAVTRGRDVLVTVRDEGPGISPENAERIFSPFFTTKPGGLGLGLCISRDMARRHGGDLRVVLGEPGPGACLELRLVAFDR